MENVAIAVSVIGEDVVLQKDEFFMTKQIIVNKENELLESN